MLLEGLTVTVALIDGDVIAHLACEGRMQGINALEFVKAEFKEQFLRQLDIDGPTLKLLTVDDIVFTPEQDEAYQERSWKCFMKVFTECMEANFATEHRMAMKGEKNFRDALFARYKDHRVSKPEKRNKFVPMMRARAVEEGLAEFAVNMEADDLLRIWFHEYKSAGRDTVICSIDKDLKCMPTRHYNIRKAEHFEMSEVDSNLFFYAQMLQGDPTDNIQGIPKIGPVKAEGLLKGLKEESEMQEVVMRSYYYAFGPRWQEEIMLNGSLLYLLKHHEDKFEIDSWPKIDLDLETPETEAIRKVIKVDKPLTIPYALEIIDPKSVVGSNAWNKAMEFLMFETAKLGNNEEPALDALEVITTRGKIPDYEIEAHSKLKALFSNVPEIKSPEAISHQLEANLSGANTPPPLSFAKVSVPSTPAVPTFAAPKPTTSAPPPPPQVPKLFTPPSGVTPPPKLSVPSTPSVPKLAVPATAAITPPPAPPAAEKPKFVFKPPT